MVGRHARGGSSSSPLLPVGTAPDDAVAWVIDGSGVVGSGGWTVEFTGSGRLRRMAAAWREISADGAHGADDGNLTCFVSSVFDEASSPAPSVLRIPEEITTVGPQGRQTRRQHVDSQRLRAAVAAHGPAEVTDRVTPAPPNHGRTLGRDGYTDAVRSVLAAIDRGEASKVVLCRDEFVEVDEPTRLAALDRLATGFPTCWTFSIGGLIGATPEMLATRRGGRVTSRVLAGSLPRGVRSDEEQRRRLATEGGFDEEHAHAVRSVLEGFSGLIAFEDESPKPFVLELPNIYHLATDVSGRVQDEATTVLDLVDGIHPTAAVGGIPRSTAVDLLNRLEPHDRGRYAGPVGWMDSTGDGEIGLALRCGRHEAGGVRLYAGGGIVAGADPDAEYTETVSKLMPMMTALGRT